MNENGLVNKLNEYKEFISILIFFAGGLFWIYGFFATKSQVETMREGTHVQVSKLNCVLEQNVKMLRGKMEFQYFTDLLEENKQEIREVRRFIRNARQDQQDVHDNEEQLLELEEQRSELKTEREKFKRTMEQALDSLTTDGCNKTSDRR
ncbi:hypothetical protein [Oceanicoccus sagamiensis]|uniref:Uncharacterized protein n=1 Tax=Oceanicoccus sagamiensis TaxID=716816 RepID=A0A1X9N7A8_9GAMM|nr:hypothetical protein [Oceanicoccus sagamiensis]ARN73958.1 hypothetical protein BST96_07405 [Oceanicoccus sagamiensis]